MLSLCVPKWFGRFCNLVNTNYDMNPMQLEQIRDGLGFIGALDQSGGSTAESLKAYGIDSWDSDEEMYDLVHALRMRMLMSPAFSKPEMIGMILCARMMRSFVDGISVPDLLWNSRGMVPFLKIDQGLQEEEDGVQLMRDFSGLDTLLDEAIDHNIFGTKMRSVIYAANKEGIKRIVEQQFDWAKRILKKGLIPILEPEIDINCPEKDKAEQILKREILKHMEDLETPVLFKLTLPSIDNFYKEIVDHPMALRVVALSGGYNRKYANELLARNKGVISAFSRALNEGINVGQSDEEFDNVLAKSINDIYMASIE